MQVRLCYLALVFLCALALSDSSKEWKKEHWNKKYVTPKKGVHYWLPKHPKPHREHHLSSFNGHHPHKNDKHTKDAMKHAPHIVGHHEAKLQGDLRPSRKHVREHYDKWARQDMHLQDLNFDTHLRENKQGHGFSHHNQGHHSERKHGDYHIGHLNKGHGKEHEFGIKHPQHHTHVQSYHHGGRKSSMHHKGHKSADKLTKNKRKKAYEKKHGRKHSRKHHY